jgi:hypothetical protein
LAKFKLTRDKKQAGADLRLVFFHLRFEANFPIKKISPLDSRAAHLIPVFRVVPLINGIVKNFGNPFERAGWK